MEASRGPWKADRKLVTAFKTKREEVRVLDRDGEVIAIMRGRNGVANAWTIVDAVNRLKGEKALLAEMIEEDDI